MKENTKFVSEIKRINGYLKEVVTFLDASGKPISNVINPLMVELKPRDILQLFVGAFLIAAPLCFTEEVWNLSTQLKNQKIYAFSVISFVVVTSYIYFNFYRFRMAGNVLNFIKRVIATYVITASSVILLLYLVDKLPIQESPEIALRRIIIISFPALFGAVLSDNLK